MLKRYGNHGAHAPDDWADYGWCSYLGGFFTGEGHLSLSRSKCTMVIKLRDDDRLLLEHLAEASGLGRVYSIAPRATTRPAAAWIVYRQDELARAVTMLEGAGVRGRKRQELEIWRRAALEFANARVERRPRDAALVAAAQADLTAARTYKGANWTPDVADRTRAKAEARIEILRCAARQTAGPLTAATYGTLRSAHPDWPTRNAIAKGFGSWADALKAAGLDHRCSARARERARQEQRQFTHAQLAARLSAREHVLNVVAMLHDQCRARPTVGRYLAHRAESDRTLPSLTKLYGLFPGGWESVLRETTGRNRGVRGDATGRVNAPPRVRPPSTGTSHASTDAT
jgi:hypothetical protein